MSALHKHFEPRAMKVIVSIPLSSFTNPICNNRDF